MNQKEFEEAVANGRQLFILDDMVVDFSEYIRYHPGGSFVLKHNVGKDISKFFYGGYSVEGNLTGLPPLGNNHSNYARIIVNDLIVA